MQQSFFKRPAFWYGIYYGAASIVIFTLIYAINFEFFGRFILWGILGLSVLITFLILGGRAERTANDGYLKYGQSFLALFIIGLIGYSLNLIFNIVFNNFIDLEFNKNLGEVVKESSLRFMQKYNTPEETIDKQLAALDKQFAVANTAKAYLKQFFSGAVMAAIFALIIAIFIKKNPPETFEDPTVLDTVN